MPSRALMDGPIDADTMRVTATLTLLAEAQRMAAALLSQCVWACVSLRTRSRLEMRVQAVPTR